MTRDQLLRLWEEVREYHEERMVELRRQADKHERSREEAHRAIMDILNNVNG